MFPVKVVERTLLLFIRKYFEKDDPILILQKAFSQLLMLQTCREWSGKMYVLYRLMKEMRKPGNGNDKIVIVSNYTQTLDLIGRMCRENSWGFCRLDGSITMKKRQKMVDEFNDPSTSLVAFLLSSKAGGW